MLFLLVSIFHQLGKLLNVFYTFSVHFDNIISFVLIHVNSQISSKVIKKLSFVRRLKFSNPYITEWFKPLIFQT